MSPAQRVVEIGGFRFTFEAPADGAIEVMVEAVDADVDIRETLTDSVGADLTYGFVLEPGDDDDE